MTNSNDDGAPRPQAEVAGDLDAAGTLNGRAGASVFSIGGPDGRGGTAAEANPCSDRKPVQHLMSGAMGSFRKRRWNSVTSLLELLGAGQGLDQ